MLTDDFHIPAASQRRDRLRLHAYLEERVVAYLRKRENPCQTTEMRYAYIRGQLDLITQLRRFALEDSSDA